jgi:hypothetical protein
VYTHFVNIYFILSVSTDGASPGVELGQTKEELVVSECRIRHLTGLLSEAERDLAKLTQQNQVLKEEIRRQQRSVEREQHAQNFEYLKNVILKVGEIKCVAYLKNFGRELKYCIHVPFSILILVLEPTDSTSLTLPDLIFLSLLFMDKGQAYS